MPAPLRRNTPSGAAFAEAEAECEPQQRFLAPIATYRFQFNQDFTFRQATDCVPYLQALGVSHCYASPLLKARSGSQHGYDITDHGQLNPEIGTVEDFEHLAQTLKAHGMGLILDIVPNHMGGGKENPWWMDVLENGPDSVYADYFDVDWHPLANDLDNKLLLPILGESYGKTLQSGALKLRFSPENGQFALDYYQHVLPINPNAYPMILSHRQEVLEARIGRTEPAFLEFRSIIGSLEHLPANISHSVDQKEDRRRERTIALSRLVTLCAQAPAIEGFVQENVRDFQVALEDPTNLSRLHRLLEHQAYRLANWRVASDEINYRRFFDVNDLVAVRAEDARVFDDTHERVFSLIEQGLITGLRIDHPDGLFDPAAYFRQLQEQAAKRLDRPVREDWQLGSEDLPLYLLIEKILAPFERLPDEWAVHGTTGYEFANAVNGLFVAQEHEKEMTRCYEKWLGRAIPQDELIYHCKRLIMKTTLNSELGVLSYQLYQISKCNWSFRDFTLHNLRDALMEVVACFPVYRTYVTARQVSKKDREYIEWAVRLAKRRSRAVDPGIYDFIQSVLLAEANLESMKEFESVASHASLEAMEKRSPETPESIAFHEAVLRFAQKFQQYSAPVMAKGVEDTSFYRYNRLVSLNEVGGELKQFGVSPASFHHQNLERLRRAPHSLLATSTHDTKRSEDVRARINVLSEMPEEWQKHLGRWHRVHRNWQRGTADTGLIPSLNDQYLFYQALLGIWPLHAPGDAELERLTERMVEYMLKAAREAKSHTSWINPDTEYETGLCQFIRGILRKPSQLFLESFLPFQKRVARFGLYNALSQTLLKLTCPGVPDIYQGTELWRFTLVDPDNRQPVDYAQYRQSLDSMRARFPEEDALQTLRLLNEGKLKQTLVMQVLQYRQAHPELFQRGQYLPLDASGLFAEHVVAFARLWEDQAVLIVAPRLVYTLMHRKLGLPCGKRIWKDTTLSLPDALTNYTWKTPLLPHAEPLNGAEIPLAELLKQLPVGFWVSA